MKPIHWRRGRFGKYLRHLPRQKHIRGTWLHRKLGDRLFAAELWHPSRHRVAAGAAVGAFFAMMPAPFQMLASALAAYIVRVNIPAAIAATWISNPFTLPVCVYAQYAIGCWILGRPVGISLSQDLLAVVKQAPLPFAVGFMPSAMLLALATYVTTLVVWGLFEKRQKPAA